MKAQVAVLGLLLAGLAWLGAWAVGEVGWRSELTGAEAEIAAGRYERARERLGRLARRRPGRDRPLLLLGVCEEAEGRIDDALRDWGRVFAGSPLAVDASMRRARLALKHGRFRIAEESLTPLIGKSGRGSVEARSLWGKLLWLSGRGPEFRRFLRQGWSRSDQPVEVLRQLWELETGGRPTEGFRLILDAAGQEAPDDDRVWLGKADLARENGRFAEADDRLVRCEAKHPDDPAVLRARLDWALAANRLDLAARTLRRLRADQLEPTELAALRARFAAERNDPAAEQAMLEQLIAAAPGDSAALDRLADLAAQAGRSDRLAELRRRKANVDRAKEQYRKLLADPDPAEHAEELALLAESLGRWFDAKAWWTISSRRGVDRPKARAAIDRIDRSSPAPTPPGGTVAEALADVITRPSDHPKANEGRPMVPRFRDDATVASLRFVFESGRSPGRQLPETMSGGVGLLDFDGDGLLDVYALQGGAFPPDPLAVGCRDRLFRNKGGGAFEDVSASSGLARMVGGYGQGVSVGDYDNDGRPDLFITRWRSYSLYHNRGDGTFEDVTARAGLGGDRDWPTSSAWADLDNDGDLDLYVCHYLRWDAEHPRVCRHPGGDGDTYCDPRDFEALPDHVFRNDGGRFVDVSSEAGIVDRDGRGLGVVAADLDDDGKVDLFVANDTTANYLFHNLGGFRFREEGVEVGVATNASGGSLAGMGVACGDLDGDGKIDLAVTNFFGESTTFYHNLGAGQFSDHSTAVGLSAPSRHLLGFGAAFLDANNDGRLDLATSNGHVNDFHATTPYKMPAQLLIGSPSGRLLDVSDESGPPWNAPRLGRGLAVGDLDGDGRLDLVIVSLDDSLAYVHNISNPSGHFLTLRLEGTNSNRDAVGARVRVLVGNVWRVSQRFGGGSYLSASASLLHFGLGEAQRVEQVEVTWPSGRIDHFDNLSADAGYHLVEGDPFPRRK